MSKNEQPEVIDSDDPRYKDDTYFKPSIEAQRKSQFEKERHVKYYTFGGCFPVGCGCLPLIAVIALIITWLISFWI